MAGNNAIELYSDLGAVERETVCKSLLVQKFQTPQHMSNQRERERETEIQKTDPGWWVLLYTQILLTRQHQLKHEASSWYS